MTKRERNLLAIRFMEIDAELAAIADGGVVDGDFATGLTNEQIAETLGMSLDTVKRDWRVAPGRLGNLLKNA